MEFEKFYAKIRKSGDSFVITIPSNYARFGGYDDGDEVIVMLKKQNIKNDFKSGEEILKEELQDGNM